MNATLGHAGVYLAFAFSLLGASSIIYGLARNKPTIAKQGHSYIWLIGFGVLLAVFAMERGLITHDFHLQFVADNNSRETPLLFTISGMWAALEGSILLWGLVLVAYIATMSFHFRKRRDDAMVAWATAITFIVAAFFFALMAGPADPFKTLAAGSVPLDGSGPNPLLQDHVLMAFHPPILYSGYVGFTIPFAFGMAALITGRVGEGWLVETRRWTLVSWGFLSAGILLGSWWSYEVLGWGGYWAWDPVENASLLPWLTATAYLHSVIVQERRGMLRIWNLSLLGATFSLTILGTFFTRSGVLDSVHAFTQSPLGPWLIGAFTVVVAATCGLIFWRGDRLGSPGSIASPLSREGAFLANNVLFAAFAFVVLLGTVFPLLTEAVNNNRISVGAPYFNSMVRPIGLLLLLLMAFAPVLQWRGTPLELIKERALRAFAFMVLVEVICVAAGVRGLWVLTGIGLGAFVAATSLRQLELSVRRRGLAGFFGRSNGGMVAHLGIAIIALGVVASQSYAHRAEFEMKDGQTVTVAGHTVQFVGLATIPHGNRTSQVAAVKIDNGKVYEPALSRFPNSTDAIGTPTVKSSFTNDVYVTLVRTPSATDANTVISVIVTPLVSWIWGGGVVIAVGTVLALIPTAPTNGRRGILDLVAAESKQGESKKEMVTS